MTDLTELQNPQLDFDRQRFLQKWLIQSRPHMATSTTNTTSTTTPTTDEAHTTITAANINGSCDSSIMPTNVISTPATINSSSSNNKFHRKNSSSNSNNHVTSSFNQVFFLMSSNGNATSSAAVSGASSRNKLNGGPGGSNANCGAINGGGGPTHLVHLGHHIEGRKPKLRRFNSHDTSSNMFSVADFENARLARRNEIELKQRLQRRMRASCSAVSSNGANGYIGASGNVGISGGAWCNNNGNSANRLNSLGGDCSTGDSKTSKHSNDSQLEPLPADIFFDRYTMPTVVRISYKTKFNDETLQSSSSNGSSTATSHSSAASNNAATSGVCITPSGSGGGGNSSSANTGTGTSSSTASSSGNNINNVGVNSINGVNKYGNNSSSTTEVAISQSGSAASNSQQNYEKQGDLFLLYKFMHQRRIYHGLNTKTALTNRKKAVLIPQEFPGYFSLVNDKGLPTATQYTSLVQLVRERVFKFISVDNIPAFAESQSNPAPSPPDGCFPIYPTQSAQNRPQYVRTTARAGEVYRLIAVFEDGKQDHNATGGGLSSNGGGGAQCSNSSAYGKSNGHGREKEKGRYAQLMSDARQVFYVPLTTKGKFYEVEPGIPVILQRIGVNESNKKINPDCVYRIAELLTPQKELPINLRYISGPNANASGLPEQLSITKFTRENIFIACPIEDVDMQRPLHLRKLYLTKEMNLLKTLLGFDNDKAMWADHNVQNVLKFCQFNCDQFLQSIEVETLQRSERSGSKQRGDGLKLLKDLHLPKLLRREKTAIPAHEKEDSIIFLTKSDLANLEAKDTAAVSSASSRLDSNISGNRISEKMKVFQSTKKKWFRKQDKQSMKSLTSLELDVQVKRMSMERYTDMSKLLQERFGDKSNTHNRTSEHDVSISEPSCSDTDTTALTTIASKLKKLEESAQRDSSSSQQRSYSSASGKTLQKSMSLQDIAIQRRKSDLLIAVDNISETGTDSVADIESLSAHPQTVSFITQKLYNEFHVRTRQYSKSSSSLNLNFSLPQKMQVNDHKRTLAQLRQNFGVKSHERPLDFNIGAPVMGRRLTGGLPLIHHSGINQQNTSLALTPTTSSLIEDELPYSSVRDSLVLSSDESAGGIGDGQQPPTAAANICQALNFVDYNKENIYAEICHEASAMGGIPSSQTRETITVDTQSTQISSSDDYGDYASLSYASSVQNQQIATNLGNAISRVQVNCSSASPVSYHTVYLGDEPLGVAVGEHQQQLRESRGRELHYNRKSSSSSACGEARSAQQSRDRAHITTVELEGNATATDPQKVENIYNTLK